MKRLAIFTAVFGGYDEIIKPTHFDELQKEVDFFCFTDNENLQSEYYKVILVKPSFKDPQRNARYYKIIGYETYLKHYDFCLWIDSNSTIVTNSFADLIKDHLDTDMAVNIHSDRNCLYDEAKWVIKAVRDNRHRVNWQLRYMRSRNFPAHYGLAATNFLLRKNNANVNAFNKVWWNMIERGSKRDQLSFDFCRWLLKDNISFRYLHYQWNNNHLIVTNKHKKEYTRRHLYTFKDSLENRWYLFQEMLQTNFIRIKSLPGKIVERFKMTFNKQVAARKKEMDRLKRLPRYTETTLEFLGQKIRVPDIASFNFMKKEIFDLGIYRFKTRSVKPYILDCGANIGLSIIYLKDLYPDAEIVGFEPDEYIFEILEHNIYAFNFKNVSLIKKACWSEETTLRFQSEGADAGRTADADNSNAVTVVETIRLRDYLQRKVDFLKIDIEGAENQVIPDISDLLNNVDKIFLEYHSFVGREQTLPQLINILKEAGFRMHISAPGLSSDSPFMNLVQYAGMDNQLNIYGFRD